MKIVALAEHLTTFHHACAKPREMLSRPRANWICAVCETVWVVHRDGLGWITDEVRPIKVWAAEYEQAFGAVGHNMIRIEMPAADVVGHIAIVEEP